MAQVGTRDGDQICMAARDDDLSHVSTLLARGVSPDARESQFGSTPLHWSGQARLPRGAEGAAIARAQCQCCSPLLAHPRRTRGAPARRCTAGWVGAHAHRVSTPPGGPSMLPQPPVRC